MPTEPELNGSPQIFAHGVTHRGHVREQNEDQFLIADIDRVLRICGSSFNVESGSTCPVNHQAKVVMVADGIGGVAHGKLASAVAVDAMLGAVASMPIDGQRSLAELRQMFQHFMESAQQRVFDVARRKHLQLQPGTTLTVAYLRWPDLVIVHAGDSRCYLMRDGTLMQLTQDHTLAAQLVEAGVDPEQTNLSRSQHVLVNAVGGASPDLRVDLQHRTLREGDTILLCSDGLHGALSTEQLQSILAESHNFMQCADDLVAAALQAGGRDNITVAVVQVGGQPTS